MTSYEWQTVERLFEEARTRPPDERDAYLDEACDDPQIRAEVRSLLTGIDDATAFFEDLGAGVPARARSLMAEGRPGASTDVESDPLGLEGTQIERYAVEAHLGGGSMGVVYRAHDTQLDRPVALKFLPPYLTAHSEAETRFVREAQSASSLDHANIATIYEIGETDDGRRFIAMAYYEGETLEERLDRRGPLPVKEAVDLATQIAEGLKAAHQAGIVHRDVKPANVMVTGDGTVKLLDFGLARAAAQSDLTDPGQRVGTAAYMSPEQADGRAVDARTDLWALGVVLYELLAGERPFRGDRASSVLYSIVHEDPTPLSDHRPRVPTAVERIVECCLRKDLDERYNSADALLEDLYSVRSGEVSAAQHTQTADNHWEVLPVRSWIVGGTAASLLILAIIAGWVFWPGGSVPERAPAGEGTVASRSIAVLPFETIGQEKSSLFTEGLHGDLLTRLSNISDLTVISRRSVGRYRDTELSLSTIADTLGVRWVLEGSVQRAGNQIQLNVQLTDPQTGTYAWSDQYRQTLTAKNVFHIQATITQKIAGSLEAELTSEEKRRVKQRPTENLTAYRLSALGRRHLDKRTEEGIRRAIDAFEQATEQDPEYVLAWVGLADALTLLHEYGYEDEDRALPRAERAVRRALDIDPKSAKAHASLGLLYEARRQGPQAIRELQRAVKLKPSYAEAHNWLSWVHQLTGHPHEALESAKRAVELNPLSSEAVANLSFSYLINGAYERALTEARREQELGSSWGTGRFFEGLALYKLGRFEEAKSVLRDLSAPWADAGPRATLALVHVAAGEDEEARALLEKFEEADHSYATGLIHAALGNEEAAFGAFRRVERWGDYWPTLSVRHYYGEVWETLRNDPRYDALIREVNRAWGLNPDGSIPENLETKTNLRPNA
jgi:serine/threonine protein kinase/thioredoxin-like negative regulator of GroEL